MENPIRTEPPDAAACLRAWKDLVDLGFRMALANLEQMGMSRSEAVQTLARWMERDDQARVEAPKRAFRRRPADGE